MNESTIEQPGAGPESGRREDGLRAYIGRHWRGENGLAYAFWVNFVIANAVVMVMLDIVSRATIPEGAEGWLDLLYVGQIAVFAWGIVGVWRSSGYAIAVAKHSRPPRVAFWAFAARAWIVFQFGFFALSLVFGVLEIFV